jgi:hypothetical protein
MPKSLCLFPCNIGGYSASAAVTAGPSFIQTFTRGGFARILLLLVFSFWTGTSVVAHAQSNTAPYGSLDVPVSGATASGNAFMVGGWVLDNEGPTLTVQLLVDGLVASSAATRAARPDVCAAYPAVAHCVSSQPGVNFAWNTTSLTNGTHQLALRATDPGGLSTTIGARSVTINNPSAPSPSAISPNQGPVGATTAVIISGTNFQSGDALSVGPGISVSNVSVISRTSLTATLTIATGSTLGLRDIRLTNIAGQSATLASGFRVAEAGTSGPALTNLAFNKPATQSSTYPAETRYAYSTPNGFLPGFAVDENSGTMSIANYGSQPWWQVDVGTVAAIQSIWVAGRLGCCEDQLQNFYVLVSDAPFNSTALSTTLSQPGVAAYYITGVAGSGTTIAVNRTGRYVRVQLLYSGYVSISELRVSGTPGPTPLNLALNKPATQSSTYLGSATPGGDAAHAVDGNTSGDWGMGSVAHTLMDVQGWWQVDLGGGRAIQTIQVWNRTDCCSTRLSDFYVFVSDVPFISTALSNTLTQPGVSAYYTAGPAGLVKTISVNRTGRFVRVQLASADPGWLSLSEVQVLGTFAAPSVVNLALNKPATQMSTFPGSTGWDFSFPDGFVPRLAVDDNPGTFSVAGYGAELWWQVDLGNLATIQSISVAGRQDGWPEQLQNFYVEVSDGPFLSTGLSATLGQAGVSAYYTPGTGALGTSFLVNRTGRYVRVQLVNPGYLSISEVQVFGTLGGPPTVTGSAPIQGPASSSIPVTITGSNFQSGATLSVGAGITVSNVAVASGSSLTATLTIAAGSAVGVRDVTVTNLNGQSGRLASGFTVVTALLPAVTGVNPIQGTAGVTMPVTITGRNLQSGAMLSLGAGVTVSNIVVPSPTQLTATLTIAPWATLGARNVTVTNPGGQPVTLMSGFSIVAATAAKDSTYVYDRLGRLIAVLRGTEMAIYQYDGVGNLLSIKRQSSAAVSILDFSPRTGPAGTSIAIIGTGFSSTKSQNTVSLNGISATVISANTTQLAVQVPSGVVVGPVAVTSPNGSATSTKLFGIAP